MKLLKNNLFVVMLFATTLLYSTDTGNSLIVSKDKTNTEMFNTTEAVDIINLSAYSRNGLTVCNFRVKSLPDEKSGTLYMADGETEVVVDQNLTHVEARSLTFDPKETFVGDAVFTYSAMDVSGLEGTLGTVTLPIIDPVTTGSTVFVVTTDDKINPEMLNTLPAVDILNLSGADEDGVAVSSFIIKSLVDEDAGTLYMSDGTTAVTVDQTLTKDEADGLKFDPDEAFVGEAVFTYQAIDVNGNLGNIGTVSLPIVGELTPDSNGTTDQNGTVEDCDCEDYNESIPTLTSFSIFLMLILTTLLGTFLTRKELK